MTLTVAELEKFVEEEGVKIRHSPERRIYVAFTIGADAEMAEHQNPITAIVELHKKLRGGK